MPMGISWAFRVPWSAHGLLAGISVRRLSLTQTRRFGNQPRNAALQRPYHRDILSVPGAVQHDVSSRVRKHPLIKERETLDYSKFQRPVHHMVHKMFWLRQQDTLNLQPTNLSCRLHFSSPLVFDLPPFLHARFLSLLFLYSPLLFFFLLAVFKLTGYREVPC